MVWPIVAPVVLMRIVMFEVQPTPGAGGRRARVDHPQPPKSGASGSHTSALADQCDRARAGAEVGVVYSTPGAGILLD